MITASDIKIAEALNSATDGSKERALLLSRSLSKCSAEDASALAVLYLEKSLSEGKTIEIPSLGIKIEPKK